jgi:hypothetical protein
LNDQTVRTRGIEIPPPVPGAGRVSKGKRGRAFSVQFRVLEKFKRLVVPCKGSLGHCGKKPQDLPPVPQVPASQLSENKHVPEHLFTAEQ